MDDIQAREALAGIGGVQARLAQAVDCPPWRHAAFGAIMGTLVGSMGLPMPMQAGASGLALLATAALVVQDRKRMGVFVNGYRRGATRVVTLALVGVLLMLMVATLHLRSSGGSAVSMLAIALIGAGVATWASVLWQRRYVRELTRGPQ